MNERRESGHALVEVLTLGLLLLVPILWMLTVAGQLHSAALATSAAAREGGFEAARSVDVGSASAAVERTVAGALDDQSLNAASAHVDWGPSGSWERGTLLEIEVSYPVPVFQLPFIGAVTDPAIVVTGRHIARLDPYRSRG